MGKKKSKKTTQRAAESDPDYEMEEEVQEEEADEASPSYTIPLQAIAHWPVERQKDIQADAGALGGCSAGLGRRTKALTERSETF